MRFKPINYKAMSTCHAIGLEPRPQAPPNAVQDHTHRPEASIKLVTAAHFLL